MTIKKCKHGWITQEGEKNNDAIHMVDLYLWNRTQIR